MELFHVLNRGVDRRKIFLRKWDYFRFVYNLYQFNNKNDSTNAEFYFKKFIDIASPIKRKPRDLLVYIHAFCLMPNHYHLLLSPKAERGVEKFMKKLNIGYAKYFNYRQNRTGALFEGRYKSILVENENHFSRLLFYIHLNPLDLVTPNWRKGEVKNFNKAFNFLQNYRWSSHLDYAGKKNFPSVIYKGFLSDVFGDPKQYEKSIRHWLQESDISNLGKILLEK